MPPTMAPPNNERAVLVDLAGLDGLQGVAAFRRHVTRRVDRAVDDPLVDVAVEPCAGLGAGTADAVDDAVDDVLVDPVHRLRDRVGDGVHDHVLVEVVEVVLLDEERVTGAGQPVALREPDERPEHVARLAEHGLADEPAEEDAERHHDQARRRVGPREIGRLGDGVDPLADRETDRRFGPFLEPVQVERRRVEVAGDDGEDAEQHERRGDLPRRVVGGERQWPAVLERCAVPACRGVVSWSSSCSTKVWASAVSSPPPWASACSCTPMKWAAAPRGWPKNVRYVARVM